MTELSRTYQVSNQRDFAQSEIAVSGVIKLSITWGADGVSVGDVLDATIERVQDTQSRGLGGDAEAKALVDLLRARAELRGTKRDVDGTPVIE